MEISIKRISDGKVIYQQFSDTPDSTVVNKIFGEMTSQPVGETLETTFVNNGHTLTARTAHASDDAQRAYIDGIVRSFNGIVKREKKA